MVLGVIVLIVVIGLLKTTNCFGKYLFDMCAWYINCTFTVRASEDVTIVM